MTETATKTARKAAKTARKTTTTKSIKEQPTDAEVASNRKKGVTKKEVKVKTASGGRMWDPMAGVWITGKPSLSVETEWLKIQVKAKKITLL